MPVPLIRVKCTHAPATGLVAASRTWTLRGPASVAETVSDWPVPET